MRLPSAGLMETVSAHSDMLSDTRFAVKLGCSAARSIGRLYLRLEAIFRGNGE